MRLLAERPEFQETEETRSVLADELVESRVRAALGDAFATPVDIRVDGVKRRHTVAACAHQRKTPRLRTATACHTSAFGG